MRAFRTTLLMAAAGGVPSFIAGNPRHYGATFSLRR